MDLRGAARDAALLWAGSTLSFKDEERLHAGRLPTDSLQTTTDPLTTDLDTQLGAFGPGADICKVQQRCVPALALGSRPLDHKMIELVVI